MEECNNPQLPINAHLLLVGGFLYISRGCVSLVGRNVMKMCNCFLACFFSCIVGFLLPTLYFAFSSYMLASFCLYSLLSLSIIQGILMVFCYLRVLEWLIWKTMNCSEITGCCMVSFLDKNDLHNWYGGWVMIIFWLVVEDGMLLELAPPCLFAPKVFNIVNRPCVLGGTNWKLSMMRMCIHVGVLFAHPPIAMMPSSLVCEEASHCCFFLYGVFHNGVFKS